MNQQFKPPVFDVLHAPTGRLQFSIGSRQLELLYPDSGHMKKALVEVLSGEEYPSFELNGYAPSVIVDIGAHVGASAIYFHSTFPDARIYCYEPSQFNFNYLRQNIAFTSAIRAFPYGLSDSAGTSKLYTGSQYSMMSSFIPNALTGETFEMAELRSAAREFEENALSDVSILKIDTEGFELPILQALGNKLGKIDFLYLEYHSEESRRAIDALVAGNFLLGGATATVPHRGLCVYVNKQIIERYPILSLQHIPVPK
jgi:FkbM family methyltransferase